MAISTYTELKAAIAAHLNRDDLTAYIDDFIDLAEATHKHEIRIREMIVRDLIGVNDRQIDLPDDALEIISLRLLTNPVTVLEEISLHEMNRLRRETTGKPSRFTIHQEIEFDVTPSEDYDGEVIYYEALTPLSSTVADNALLLLSPNAYLYGALMGTASFLGNDDRIATWGNLYVIARDGLNRRANSSRRVGPLVSRVAGATP